MKVLIPLILLAGFVVMMVMAGRRRRDCHGVSVTAPGVYERPRPERRTDEFVTEVEALLVGTDVQIVQVRPGGVSGWEDIIEIACGKSTGNIWFQYDRPDSMSTAAQVKVVSNFVRKREAERLANLAAVESTVARFYEGVK
jgi:hypothetical protein